MMGNSHNKQGRGKVLYLPLKKCWFELIKQGIKPEEYRERNEYWGKRFTTFDYDAVEFSLGYPKKDDTERRIRFNNPRLREGLGREEWGATPGKVYYIISFDKKDEAY